MQAENGMPARGAAAPRVLLTDTTRWATSARLAIRLAKAGIEVSAVCMVRGHPLRKTSAVKRLFPASPLDPVKSLRTAIEKCDPQFIIACDDRAVQHLHELYAIVSGRGRSSSRSIAALIERSLGAPRSYPIVTGRYELLRIAREEGIRVPETGDLETVEDLQSWISKIPFPWVIKADGTFGGRGVRIAQNLAEAQQAFFELQGLFGLGRALKRLIVNRDPFWLRPWWNNIRPSIIVQSYVEGRPTNCGVMSWEGQVLAGIGVDVISTPGITAPATVVNVVDSPDMTLAAERIARRLKLSGFFGLDFMVEERTGEAYLIEMNPRCTPPCHLQLGAGRDLAGSLWAKLSGNQQPTALPITEEHMIAYFPEAWLYQSPLVQSSYQDVPWEEPALVRELLNPWPERTLASKLANAAFLQFGTILQRFRGSSSTPSEGPVRPPWIDDGPKPAPASTSFPANPRANLVDVTRRTADCPDKS